MLISRGCSWVTMKRGGCKFGDSKTKGCPLSKRGAVVSQLVHRLKESGPPPGTDDKCFWLFKSTMFDTQGICVCICVCVFVCVCCVLGIS